MSKHKHEDPKPKLKPKPEPPPPVKPDPKPTQKPEPPKPAPTPTTNEPTTEPAKESPDAAVILTGTTQGVRGEAHDFREVVAVTEPHRDRIFAHNGRLYEHVGEEAGRRVYRDHTR